MGKGRCFYEDIDPEVKEGCHAWLRNHQTKKGEDKQLSLFD
ncbi:hypothetical protein B4135_0994 [Caldibacillus debilis]|uniref:Uncharacterized protein n=1 Tax=Caldibacillus debilis TaxID=301148 RepID=A0A150MFB9_9BACI|nr:hypothetical protein B4135_0994 [Caldibacillus debilis]